MAETVRLTGHYQGHRPGDEITVSEQQAERLRALGVLASGPKKSTAKKSTRKRTKRTRTKAVASTEAQE